MQCPEDLSRRHPSAGGVHAVDLPESLLVIGPDDVQRDAVLADRRGEPPGSTDRLVARSLGTAGDQVVEELRRVEQEVKRQPVDRGGTA